MRQALEGIAMALLCSTDELVVIDRKKKRGVVRAVYWRKVDEDDSRVHGHHALRQLGWNAEVLGVNPAGVAFLQRVQETFHPFSHCGRAAIASRAVLERPASFYIGGHFEAAKLDGYRGHIVQHIGLSGVLPLLRILLRTLAPAEAAPEARALAPV